MQKEQIFNEILKNRQSDNYFSHKDTPFQGQFVSTGIQHNDKLENRIGYVLQIRKNAGIHGSDIYLLRHSNKNIIMHENQSFFSITKEQEDTVKKFFEIKPEEENFLLPYSLYGGQYPEIGFIIYNK